MESLNGKQNRTRKIFTCLCLSISASFLVLSWFSSEGGKFEIPRNLLECLGLKNSFSLCFTGWGWEGSHVTLLGKGQCLGRDLCFLIITGSISAQLLPREIGPASRILPEWAGMHGCSERAKPRSARGYWKIQCLLVPDFRCLGGDQGNKGKLTNGTSALCVSSHDLESSSFMINKQHILSFKNKCTFSSIFSRRGSRTSTLSVTIPFSSLMTGRDRSYWKCGSRGVFSTSCLAQDLPVSGLCTPNTLRQLAQRHHFLRPYKSETRRTCDRVETCQPITSKTTILG